MAVPNLIFSQPRIVGSPTPLLFGESADSGTGSTVTVNIAVTLGSAVNVTLLASQPVFATVTATLSNTLSTSANITYDNRVTPWTLCQAKAPHNAAALSGAPLNTPWAVSQPKQIKPSLAWGSAQQRAAGAQAVFDQAQALSRQPAMSWGTGDTRPVSSTLSVQKAVAKCADVAAVWQLADTRRVLAQIMLQTGISKGLGVSSTWHLATPLSMGLASPVGASFFMAGKQFVDMPWQVAAHPLAGRSALPVVPPVLGPRFNADLLFECPRLVGSPTHLLFSTHPCDPTVPTTGTVFVPIREVYFVLNTSSLRRVDGNLQIATFAMSLSLDVDSWTWQFSASMPAEVLPLLEPSASGDPVEVEAMINGSPYRMLVESINRERAFAQSSIRVSGRGIAATLDAPYAPVQSFTNTGARTAQQLMSDVLTVNGASLGWTINWGLTDWLVPAGVFNHNGSYINAINSIAASAGGYLQPSGIGKILNVLPRYKVAPWNWAAEIAPEYQLPVDLMTREGVQWVERARYNRVYVSGQGEGVLGRVTRQGTAGELAAPMVVDSLITHADAARQRGVSILGNTGRIANISLKLPVLAETNIITPGKYVDFVDGTITRRGVVRSVQVETQGITDIWQTIGVETHA